MAAVPLDLWHGVWSPPRARAPVPPMSSSRHEVLNGSLSRAMDLSINEKLTRSLGRPQRRDQFQESRRQRSLASSAAMSVVTGVNRDSDDEIHVPMIQRHHDASTASRTYEVGGESFVSFHDADRYRRTIMQTEASHTTSRRRAGFLATLTKEHAPHSEVRAKGAPRASTLILGSAAVPAAGRPIFDESKRSRAYDTFVLASDAIMSARSVDIHPPDAALSRLDDPNSAYAAAMRSVTSLEDSMSTAYATAYVASRMAPLPASRRSSRSEDTRASHVLVTVDGMSPIAMAPGSVHDDTTLEQLLPTLGDESAAGRGSESPTVNRQLQFAVPTVSASPTVTSSPAQRPRSTTPSTQVTALQAQLRAAMQQIAELRAVQDGLQRDVVAQLQTVAAAAEADMTARDDRIAQLQAQVLARGGDTQDAR